MTTGGSGAVITRITSCRSCSGSELTPFLDLGEQPFANSLLSAADQPEESYPLALTFCHNCGLVQLTHTADPAALFSHYLWVTGTSSTARSQADRFCLAALTRLPTGRKPRLVVEAASNDGTFLRPFMSRGIDVIGIDPAANVVKAANAAGVPTKCLFFNERAAEDVRSEHGPADIVIARNVLAHVADLHSFVKGVAALIGTEGLAAIEFHYGFKILEGLQYDSVYHEHLCYLTAGSVQNLLSAAGLDIVDLAEGPISGGALIVYARRKGATQTPAVAQYLNAEAAAGANTLAAWQKFGRRVFEHRRKLLDLLDSGGARRVAGYGASARSSTLLNFCGIDSRRLVAIADANPMKHGRFTAGTRIPVRSPESVFAERPDAILMLAWNFKSELMELLRNRLGFRGRVIVPLPGAPVVETLS